MASVIHSDPDILGGTPVFRGTRVPVESLFDHLADSISLDEFLDDFPTVSREQAVAVLQSSSQLLQSLTALHDENLVG
ncbi:MAG: DUF433 domain-containing protein [Candidatus Kapabacteria bacterium]|jgi:uncharacterized protein (DUF433 family)|nr:DUF433 domain-containing protein [Candidatus Kapabacteria bacterium]